MLNKLKDVLHAARHTFSSDASLLKKGLQGLAFIDKALPERAGEFIVSGEGEDVLLDLRRAAPNAGRLLGNPGRVSGGFYFHSPNKAEISAIEGSLRSRNLFYEGIKRDPEHIELLVRLGKALEAADQGSSLVRTGAQVPDWLQYLANDALCASFDTYNPTVTEKNRPIWNVNLIHDLLAAEGLPGTHALQLIFERKGIDAYYQDRVFARLLAADGLDDYMLAHRDAVESLTGQLSASGRCVLAGRIGNGRGLTAPFARLLVRLAVDSGKTVRAVAAAHLEKVPVQQCTDILADMLAKGETEARTHAAELLARTQGGQSASLLEKALAEETSKPVQQAIRAALSRLQAADDASTLDLPEPPAWQKLEEKQLGEDAVQLLMANRIELLERHRKAAEEESEQNKTAQYKYTWRQKHYKDYAKLTDGDLRKAVEVLNGKGGNTKVFEHNGINETIGFGNKLETLPEFGIAHLIRWLSNTNRRGGFFWYDQRFQKWLQRQDTSAIDLRMLSDLLSRSGYTVDSIALACLRAWWTDSMRPMDALPAERVWPFFAEHPEFIDEGLGLRAAQRGQYDNLELGQTLDVLATFPVIPARWLPRLMEIALGEGKMHRGAAQKVLGRLPDIGRRVIESLASSKQEIRIEAARWLADLDYRDAVPALYKALDKESRETARAAMLTALERLGEDISPRLAPEVLRAEAQKGLKAKTPAGLAWFLFDGLPACSWQNGGAVEPEIIRWWVILACKLKEPGGNALLERYLQLLDERSRAALGSVVLRQFITRDTLHPSLEEGIAHAQANAQQRYQQYQEWARKWPEYYEAQGKMTPEQVFEQVKREKMSEYLGSAIGEKGILALIHGTPGHEIVSLLQGYMRDHYQRRAQIEAMIEAAAVANDPVVIQMLLGLSRRYRTASVQEKARALVADIANRNGWTQDQLADRTIPTAGFDESGRLDLQYGERLFYVTLDEAMKPVLHNPEGKVVKALPEARQNDAPESIKEAKSLFATCKKELKQVIEMQTARLYEAMCAGRLWPAEEWHQYLYRHPIVGRLVQRLVWQEVPGDGQILRLLRPTEDGSLIDVEDNEVEPAAGSRLRLAHGSLVGSDEAKAWHAHFKDYKVTPLFPQMARLLPDLAALQKGALTSAHAGDARNTIADRLGWFSDTFTLRGAFSKLGYQRAQAEDGGFFYLYTKDFTSAGVRVVIEFSGNTLPEENVPAALKTVGFENLKVRGYRERSMALKDVPPVLLAEAYADYHAIADACAGYDAGWEKKIPW
ncbi:hypothetical protein GCM10027343_09460 [Noviherbaspirillum agri]